MEANTLCYGDSLDVLRRCVAKESADLFRGISVADDVPRVQE